MATEKNPYDMIPQEGAEIVPINQEDNDIPATFEVADDGGVIVDLSGATEMEADEEVAEWYGNLAEDMSDEELEEIAETVLENYEADKDSRSEWEAMFERGFELLGLKLQQGTEPFEGACTAVHPLLIESAVKFQSKASGELFPSNGPIKAQILGDSTTEKEQQANRVQNFMNYQLTEQMPEYFEEFERMLFHLPLIGSAFKKMYYDATVKRPRSEFIPIDQFYVSYYASDLSNAERYTHVIYRSLVEMNKDIKAGIYMDTELVTPSSNPVTGFSEKMDTIIGLSPDYDNDPQYVLLEQHCYLDIEEEEESCPYIVTVEKDSRKVLSIRRNYKQDDKSKEKISHFVHYRFVPGFGFYGLGLIHFLGNLTMSATAAMRSLIDAGQFANLPGGFKSKGIRIVGDNEPISPGEFKEVEATGVDLSKAIIPLPYKEPSSVLFQMLNFVTAAGQKFADSTEQVISDAASYGPVGTTMALLEASSKFFSAIHKRIHKSQRDEFRILARIDYDYLPGEYPYDVPFESRSIFKSDFDGRVDIIPVSDPNIPSNAHRMMLANMVLQMAQQSPPGMFNMEELNRTILNATNMPNVDDIIPPKITAQPLDPVSDIMAATKGMPIAAFAGQNHDAHIQVKMAYMQDPANGGNPIMQRIAPILQANVQEHSVMKYQEQMNGVAQQMLQQVDPSQVTPAATEMALAQAAQQVMNANMAAGQAQSPEQQLVALEQQKVQLEQAKIQSQTASDAAELELKNKELEMKETGQIIDMLKATAQSKSREEQAEENRVSKEAIKEAELQTKLQIEEGKLDLADKKEYVKVLVDMLKKQQDDDKEMDQAALENLIKLADSQFKEMRNDAEG